MKVEFFEGDESGEHIIVVIDGKRMILSTDKTIKDLLKYKGSETDIHTEALTERANKAVDDVILKAVSDVIERNDIVQCVRVLERAQGADVDIRLGCEYRIAGIKKISVDGQQIVEHYEVIDDHAPIPRRVMVSPVEVALLRKHIPGPKKVLVFEERTICGFCGEENVLVLNQEKNKYIGPCLKCGKEIEIERPAKENSRT